MGVLTRTASFIAGEGKALPAPRAMPNIVEAPFLASVGNRPAVQQLEAKRHLEAYGGEHHAVDWAYDAVRVWQYEAGKASYHFERDGKELVTARTLDTPSDAEDAPSDLANLLKHPNTWQTWLEFLDFLWIDLLLVGNHYWLKFASDTTGRPVSLFRLAPQFMSIVPGTDRLVERYEYKLPGENEPMVLAPEDIVHFKLPNPHSPGGLMGMGLVQAGARGFDVELGLVDAQATFFENGTLLAGVINSDRSVPEPLRRKILRQMRALYGGSKNFYNVAVLERGLKYQPIQPNANDAAFDTLSSMSRARIFALLGVPTLLGGISDDARTQITYDDAKMMFAEGMVRPLLDRLQGRISAVLTQAWGLDFVFDYEYVLPEATRLTNAKNFATLPGVKVKEVRNKMGLEALGPKEKAPDGKLVDDMILNLPGVSTEVPGGTPDNLPGQTNGGGRPADPSHIPPIPTQPPSAADNARRARHAANAGAKAMTTLPELAVVDRLLEERIRAAEAPSLEAGVTGALLEGKALKKAEREQLVGRVNSLPLWSLYRGVRERVVNAIAEGVRRGYTVDQILDGVEGEDFESVRGLLRRLEVQTDG